MSFILEALKKSEQQRQKQNAPKSKVRKRTLSLQAGRSGRRLFPWLVAVLLPLLVLGGWWLFSQRDMAQVTEQSIMIPAPASPPAVPETAETTIAVHEPASSPPVAESALQQPAVDAEPAPVPRSLGSAPVAAAKATEQRIPKAPSPRRTEVLAPRKILVGEAPESATSEMAQESSQLPLYNDLSREMRAQMPILDMSMHFYTPEPGRRMVRINDHLLHEGNWVDSNLQLVEITPTGAVLDFLGKSFELRRARR